MLDIRFQLEYKWNMQKPRLTKTISFDRNMALTIEKIARQERRSFTQQVEMMLENALKKQETQPIKEAEAV